MQVNRKNFRHNLYTKKVEEKLAKEKKDMLNARPEMTERSKMLAERRRQKLKKVPEPV
jgi:hypothetical protein